MSSEIKRENLARIEGIYDEFSDLKVFNGDKEDTIEFLQDDDRIIITHDMGVALWKVLAQWPGLRG